MLKVFRKIGFLCYFSLIASVLFFLGYRAYGVWSIVSRHTGRNEPIYLNIINKDAIVVSVILLLLYFGLFKSKKKIILWLNFATKLLALFITIFYAVDSFLLLKLFRRLHYGDILNFGTEIKAGLSLLSGTRTNLISAKLVGIILAAVFIISVFSFLTLKLKNNHVKTHNKFILCSSLFFLIIGLIPIKNTVPYQNIFVYNLPKGCDLPYSENFIENLRKIPECVEIHTGENNRPDIILLLVESLSSSQSLFFSGINNFTPHFDSIAEQNLSFFNFIANGASTDQGLVALLLGILPLPAVDSAHRGPFQTYQSVESLPFFLKKYGYKTYFLTTGDLSFTNKGAWLNKIGFDVIEGDETPEYKKWPRYAFNAAPDEALYNHAEKLIKILKINGRPDFVVIETVSSHLPFIDPYGQSNTEESVIRYVDQQMGKFYTKLLDLHFFKNGLLLITGDHRIMAPLSSAEIKKYGDSAFTRVPLVVADGGKRKGKNSTYFQQTDLYSSFKWLVSEEYKKTPWDGNFLQPNPEPAICILAHMVNNVDLVYAFCGSAEGYIKLEGDKTHLIKGEIEPLIAKMAVEKINRNRIFLH